MSAIPLSVAVFLVASVSGQILAISLLPRTQGFTNPIPTVGCVSALIFSSWMTARITQQGVDIGILVPFMAAVIPLAIVFIGIFVYGEPASLQRVLVLAGACALVGIASRLG